jgi:hypothetical protein
MVKLTKVFCLESLEGKLILELHQEEQMGLIMTKKQL